MPSEIRGLLILSDRELLFRAVRIMLDGLYSCEFARLGNEEARLAATPVERPFAGVIVDSENRAAELIRRVQSGMPHVPVVAWQRSNSNEASLRALELGAQGVLHDVSTTPDVITCLKTIAEGHVWVPQSVCQASLDYQRFHLSPREWQIMSLIPQGLRNKEIAYALGITEGTVKVYMSRMFDKLGVSDRYELALLGLRHCFPATFPGATLEQAKLQMARETRENGYDLPKSVFAYRPALAEVPHNLA